MGGFKIGPLSFPGQNGGGGGGNFLNALSAGAGLASSVRGLNLGSQSGLSTRGFSGLSAGARQPININVTATPNKYIDVLIDQRAAAVAQPLANQARQLGATDALSALTKQRARTIG